jgi:hypothetical protein
LFANLIWNLQGPLQSLVFGNPDKPTTGESVAASSDTAIDLGERLDEFSWMLDSALKQCAAVSAANSVAADSQTVDPATILSIINLVLQLIDAWRKRKQTPQPIPQA